MEIWEIALVAGIVILSVAEWIWYASRRTSEEATSLSKKDFWGYQFLGYMLIAAILLDTVASPSLRNVVTIVLGVVGIGLLVWND